MRARMTLMYAGIDVQIREIDLRQKPSALLQVSPKGTVPVLVLPNGSIFEESLDIVYWALAQQDEQGWLAVDLDLAKVLIAENDGAFKKALDRYKYPDRFPDALQADYRTQGEVFLQRLERQLNQNRYLLAETISVADTVIFPFIRQFAAVDSAWFASAPYPKLQTWLSHLVESTLFISIMQKQPTYVD